VLARATAPLHGVGGLERHVLDLVRHVARRGIQVTLITKPPRPGVPASLDCGAATRFVPYLTFPFAGRRGTTVLDRSSAYPLFGWRAGRVAAQMARSGEIHIVHGLGASAWGYAEARRRDWLGTVPFVFNPQGLEEFGATDPSRARLKRLGYRPLQAVVRRTAAAADRVIATDRALVPTVLEHLDVQASRVRVVPNAIDLDDVDRLTDPTHAHGLRHALGLGARDVLLLSVGRLEENKGFHDLLAALARLKVGGPTGTSPLGAQWRFVLIGDGPHRARLERQAAAADLGGYVVFAGRVSDAELHSWYEAATLFVHPTLYEGSSLVTLEAMAHRRAVVGTMAGGLPDKIRPGLNGWLVEPGNPAALARALADALETTAPLDRMGAQSRDIVVREFAWPAVADRLIALYDEVLSDRGSRPAVR
jgi:glycogen(starch) synthase